MGDTYNTTVDVGEWWTFVLAAGAEQQFWFTWGFDSEHLVYFDASPDSTNSEVWTLSQGAKKDIYGGLSRWATFKNPGTTDVAFRPRCIIAPKR